MISLALESSATEAKAEALLAPSVLAAIAVRAALAVPGVRRVEPGVSGLVTSVVRATRQRIKGLNPVATEGARVTAGSGGVLVEVGVAVAGQAMAVGNAVREAVAAEIAAVAGVSAEVTVVVLDIELPR